MATDRGLDPALHDFRARKLLEPGWAGLLSMEEGEYIADELAMAENQSLRRAWGFSGRETFPLVQIAERAFPENPAQARSHMLGQQQTGAKHLKASPGAEYKKTKGRRRVRRVKTMLGPGQVYCLCCKAGREMLERAVVGATQKGAQVVQGRCATCGTKLVTFAAAQPCQGRGRGERVAVVGEASAPKAEDVATHPVAEGAVQGALWPVAGR